MQGVLLSFWFVLACIVATLQVASGNEANECKEGHERILDRCVYKFLKRGPNINPCRRPFEAYFTKPLKIDASRLTQLAGSAKNIWTNAHWISGAWRFRGEKHLQIPTHQLVKSNDLRLKCLMYSIPREKYIPIRCSQKVTALCVYSPGEVDESSSDGLTEAPSSGGDIAGSDITTAAPSESNTDPPSTAADSESNTNAPTTVDSESNTDSSSTAADSENNTNAPTTVDSEMTTKAPLTIGGNTTAMAGPIGDPRCVNVSEPGYVSDRVWDSENITSTLPEIFRVFCDGPCVGVNFTFLTDASRLDGFFVMPEGTVASDQIQNCGGDDAFNNCVLQNATATNSVDVIVQTNDEFGEVATDDGGIDSISGPNIVCIQELQ